MKIAIGSKNPAKVKAVEEAFRENGRVYELVSIQTNSGVNDQPLTDEETLKGAINRAERARLATESTIGIGLEGGVTETIAGLALCNWGVLSMENESPIIAGGARFLLPEEMSTRLRQGEELGPIMDEYCQTKDVSKKEGAVGVFSNGKISRQQMFEHVLNLLIGQWEYRCKSNKGPTQY
ncbi:DUF84 family protein [Bacillus sp. 2205SS5-2]|uniref:DUF84 family protein n=1 Tax=Bacillus sp. 2205SS5-2 TaxID=3109031 RepID=UPI0030060F91